MRLVKVKLLRFRRFAESQSLDLNEDLIALVGPNEAGKSSVLTALQALGGGARIQASDTTRNLPGEASVAGLFVLDDDDRAALTDIEGGRAVKSVWVETTSDDSTRVWTVQPPPHRDLAPRSRCRDLLVGLSDDPALSPEFSTNDEWRWEPEVMSQVMTLLESQEETLGEAATNSISSLAHRLQSLQYPAVASEADETASSSEDDTRRKERRDDAADALSELARLEALPTPYEQVIKVLNNRLPAFVAFEDADRRLQRTYSVAEIAGSPSPALRNLCKLAGLDLFEVKRELEAGRIPHLVKLFEDANKRLKDSFRGTWTQSQVYPHFPPPIDGVLHVCIATEGEADYSYPDERSDGLRWFLALHAFIAASEAEQPVLLVDEAETHLHYDGQADLIDALMRQRVASKVIYTTHSVGCLPPDLGCGIRAVLPVADTERSRIVSSYWSVQPEGDDRVGYAPLLFAMGAQLLSLTVPRYGLVVEGPSDAILLPSLIREATGLGRLPYRVVPGLSELAEGRVKRIPLHAARAVCLTDDDEGGQKIREKLERGGFDPDMLPHLGQVKPDSALEDLVLADLFAEAVNAELETWDLGSLRITKDEIPDVGRWTWLEHQGEATNTTIGALCKPRIAQRMVDAGRQIHGPKRRRARLDRTTAKRLADLHLTIVTAFGIEARH